jgi:hypothetical protein
MPGEQDSALMHLGTIAYLRGDVAGAAAAYQEALALPGGAKRRWARRNLGYLALEGGQPEEAAVGVHEALEDPWSRRHDSAVLEDLTAMAARGQQQWQRSARLLGATDAGLERLGGGLAEPLGQQQQERTRAAAREQLGEPAFAAGRALSLAKAVAEALDEDAWANPVRSPKGRRPDHAVRRGRRLRPRSGTR